VSSTGVSVLLMTAPDQEKAAEIARALVTEGLIACANVVPKIRSIYRWEGKVCDEAEVLVIMKAPRAKFEALSQRVRGLHPYTTPELIELDVTRGLPSYLEWVLAS